MTREFVFLNPSHEVDGFKCSVADLREFLVDDAINYQRAYMARTFLILEDGELAAFFALAADSIQLKVPEIPSGCEEKTRTYPALKLARLATDSRFEGRRIASDALEFCVGAARAMNEVPGVGCRFVTVDALPTAKDWYENRGFVPNLRYRRRDVTLSMRLDVLVD